MSKKVLITALLLLAVSGLLLHLRIHSFIVKEPGTQQLIFDRTRFLSFLFPMLDIIFVTLLFLKRKTAAYGYILNGFIVIYGTVFMAHYSIAEMLAKSIPPAQMLLKSTLPDIGIAWGDFFIGKALYDLYIKGEIVQRPEILHS
ncbi:MAG: hypothetical protein HY756_08545 [Nitrospirae bacterium]|nr:hypothetical protein [Nitrospirota bacterium]